MDRRQWENRPPVRNAQSFFPTDGYGQALMRPWVRWVLGFGACWAEPPPDDQAAPFCWAPFGLVPKGRNQTKKTSQPRSGADFSVFCFFFTPGIAVVSHSPADVIRRHYESHPWADFIRPDLVLGWDQDRQIADGICLDPREVLDFDGGGPSPSDSRSKTG